MTDYGWGSGPNDPPPRQGDKWNDWYNDDGLASGYDTPAAPASEQPAAGIDLAPQGEAPPEP